MDARGKFAPRHALPEEVNATTGSRSIAIPEPPAPRAFFLVMADADAAQIEQARRNFPRDHLLLAVLYAQAGTDAIARNEVALVTDNRLGGKLLKDLSERQ